MKLKYYSFLFLSFFIYAGVLEAQDHVSGSPVVIEAESGTNGGGFSVSSDGSITYVTAKENYTGQTNPGDSVRTITFSVTFSEAGSYQLYARINVGPGSFNDDSFFAANGFGKKGVTTDADWIFVNGLGGAGYTNSTDFVKDLGAAGSGVWKWVNISQNFFAGDLATKAFVVEESNLTLTFQIGSREDGLLFDKFAFGKSELNYTVETLDKVLPGLTELPEPIVTERYPGPPLAEGHEKFLGNLKAFNDTEFLKLWNQLTPENESKWSSVGNSTDSTKWNWGGLDNLYKFSKDNNLIFKFHTLVWGSQQPTWISTLADSTKLKYIETWMRQAGKRYPNADLVDVVNEPLPGHNPPDGTNGRANYKNALGGNGTTGWDWVIKSFELARKYFPNSKLVLNEYGIINDNNATNNYLKIINLLKDRGLIDGIGVQGHRFELEGAAYATLRSNLDKLAATGIPVYISELDLGNQNNAGTPNDDQQRKYYEKIFPILWEHPGVKGITLWGYIQGRMWQETCHLVNADGSWRPALTWLEDYLKNNPSGTSTYSLSESGIINYPNPVKDYTNFRFNLEKESIVSIKVYDILGQEVSTVINDKLEKGNHEIMWKATNQKGVKLSKGTYLYRLSTEGKIITGKLIVL
ncbi:MAG: endo-1,4-beta-xylanase [Prolixibacteraceae bacterium]|nr:endo-1,4-beta-xylanase [Prolixibacteraceae bacterium]